jgi:mRNA interferase MazF
VRRGEIWWANFPQPEGSGPGHRRPALVMQANEFNRSRIQTVLVVVITSNVRLAKAPGNVPLPKGESGLTRDSVANVSQVMTLDRRLLSDRIGPLPQRLLWRVEAGLRLALAL